jgi:hypothetical protein
MHETRKARMHGKDCSKASNSRQWACVRGHYAVGRCRARGRLVSWKCVKVLVWVVAPGSGGHVCVLGRRSMMMYQCPSSCRCHWRACHGAPPRRPQVEHVVALERAAVQPGPVWCRRKPGRSGRGPPGSPQGEHSDSHVRAVRPPHDAMRFVQLPPNRVFSLSF